MNKILVEVLVPAGNTKFDVFIPAKAKGYDVLNIIADMFSSMLEGKYVKSHDSVLCVYDTRKLLDINKSMYEQNIENGTKLILI